MYWWARAHKLAHFCWIICCSTLCSTQKQDVSSPLLLVFKPATAHKFCASCNLSRRGGCESSCFTAFLKQLWLKKALCGGSITTRKCCSNFQFEMRPCTIINDEQLFTEWNSWIQDGHQLVDKTLKCCSSYSLPRYSVIHQAGVHDTVRVMFTFCPLGQTSQRTRSPLGALPMVLRVEVWNQICHYGQCAGGDLHYTNIQYLWSILVYRQFQLGTIYSNWQTMLHIQTGA